MLCPRCQKETQVIESRTNDITSIRRRRECLSCGFRFTTYEKIEPIKFIVIKRDGRRETYQPDKLLRGLKLATQKRGWNDELLEGIVSRIENKLLERGECEIPSKLIGNFALGELLKLDKVAYLRFSSVYKSFKSLKSFEKELTKLSQGGER